MSISEQDAPQTNSPGLDEPLEGKTQRARVWKSLVLLTAAVTVLAIVNLARLDRLTGDQFTLLAVVNYEQDPSAYENDGLFKDPSWYQAYLPWYRALVVQLTQWTGDGAVAMWVMSVGLTAAMAMAFWLLFYWMKVDPMLATVGAVIGILPRAATGSELTGAGVIEAALPRTFFSVGFPLVVFLIIKTQGRGRWCVAGFFLLGLLGNFHPQSAFFATAGLLLLMLAQRFLQWRAWAQVTVCGLAAVLGILPFGLTYPWEVAGAKSKDPAEQTATRLDAFQELLVVGETSQEEEAEATDASEELAVPEPLEEPLLVEATEDMDLSESLNESAEALTPDVSTEAVASSSDLTKSSAQPKKTEPLSVYVVTFIKHFAHAMRMMDYKITLSVFGLAVVPMLLAVRLLRSDRQAQPDHLLVAARFCYLAAVLISCLSFGSEVLNRLLSTWHYSVPFLDSVQPLRANRLVAPLCVAAFVLLLSKYRHLESFSLRRVQWAMVIIIFPVGVSLAAGKYIFQSRYQPVREAARWAKENTEPGTLFLVQPDAAIAFRVWAQRPVVWAEHDAVCVKATEREETRAEIREIDRNYRKKKAIYLLRLAREYQAKYIHTMGAEEPANLAPYRHAGPFLQYVNPNDSPRVALPLASRESQPK